jgi:transcriptional regulator of acetoin/glycerol metabolism
MYKGTMPNANSFEMALKEAKKALEEAYEQRNSIEQRIVILKQTIDGLAALSEPGARENLVQVRGDQVLERYNTSLTDAIRQIFSETSEPMLTPPEVRDRLLAMGVNLAKYNQPLVPIHNTLKRLEAQGELIPFLDDVGDLRGYRWVSPLARAVAEVGRNRPMEELEKQTILNALRQVNGDKMLAARMLGIGKTTLYRKLERVRIPKLSSEDERGPHRRNDGCTEEQE